MRLRRARDRVPRPGAATAADAPESRLNAPPATAATASLLRGSLALLGDPMAWFFGTLLMLYVGAEAAIYVWAPTYFAGYQGSAAWLVAYTVSVFFVLRAAGRFLGAWLLARFDWSGVLAACSGAMALLSCSSVSFHPLVR